VISLDAGFPRYLLGNRTSSLGSRTNANVLTHLSLPRPMIVESQHPDTAFFWGHPFSLIALSKTSRRNVTVGCKLMESSHESGGSPQISTRYLTKSAVHVTSRCTGFDKIKADASAHPAVQLAACVPGASSSSGFSLLVTTYSLNRLLDCTFGQHYVAAACLCLTIELDLRI